MSTTKVKALEATGSDFNTFHHTVIERRELRPDDVAMILSIVVFVTQIFQLLKE
ncbi:hypothetical protein [Pediococcus ethanolidurans]|uniref:hypothetical protein n=1 Tax=Pediococcus ethanolidurans TaxID=319653 RepID=UPI002953193D|nr:hypothetical protein [Pediococcus ethanolidurans]